MENLAPFTIEDFIDHVDSTKIFVFTQGLQVVVGTDSEGLWVCHNVFLDLTGYGETIPEALDQFEKSFSACWHGLEGNLSPEAQELKKNMGMVNVTVLPVVSYTTCDHAFQKTQSTP